MEYKIRKIDEIADVFSIFHDGSIINWAELEDGLELEVSCIYLAELINKDYELFYIKLINIHEIFFEPWYIQQEKDEKITGYDKLFTLHLEIMSGKIMENHIGVFSYTRSYPELFSGGILKIGCDYITVFDQKKNALSYSTLDNLCRTYWRG